MDGASPPPQDMFPLFFLGFKDKTNWEHQSPFFFNSFSKPKCFLKKKPGSQDSPLMYQNEPPKSCLLFSHQGFWYGGLEGIKHGIPIQFITVKKIRQRADNKHTKSRPQKLCGKGGKKEWGKIKKNFFWFFFSQKPFFYWLERDDKFFFFFNHAHAWWNITFFFFFF